MKTISANIILFITTVIAETAAAKFDYSAKLTGKKRCGLINVVVDESKSTQDERNFLNETAIPRISSTLQESPYDYDEIFLCGAGFAGGKNANTQYRHKGCTTVDSAGTIKNDAVVTWIEHAGPKEDGWTGMMKSMEDVYGTIEGIELVSTCGTIDKNLILLTDEDRDDKDSALTFAIVKQKIADNGYILNVIAKIKILDDFKNVGMIIETIEGGGSNNIIFRQDSSEPRGYKNFTDPRDYRTFTDGAGQTHDHYSDLVEDSSGALWSIQSSKREKTSQTFAYVFVMMKVKEMCPNPPECSNDASSNGDPHFKTWKQEHFEFHGQCDMILAKDSDFANGIGLDVQIRTKIVRFWSYIHTAAIRIGNDILEIQGSPDNEDHEAHYWFNFQYQDDTKAIGGFPLTIRSTGGYKRFFEIDLNSKFPGQKIVLSAFKESLVSTIASDGQREATNSVCISLRFKVEPVVSFAILIVR